MGTEVSLSGDLLQGRWSRPTSQPGMRCTPSHLHPCAWALLSHVAASLESSVFATETLQGVCTLQPGQPTASSPPIPWPATDPIQSPVPSDQGTAGLLVADPPCHRAFHLQSLPRHLLGAGHGLETPGTARALVLHFWVVPRPTVLLPKAVGSNGTNWEA